MFRYNGLIEVSLFKEGGIIDAPAFVGEQVQCVWTPDGYTPKYDPDLEDHTWALPYFDWDGKQMVLR